MSTTKADQQAHEEYRDYELFEMHQMRETELVAELEFMREANAVLRAKLANIRGTIGFVCTAKTHAEQLQDLRDRLRAIFNLKEPPQCILDQIRKNQFNEAKQRAEERAR